MGKIVYTIGHSNLDLEDFLALLKKYDIQILIDVRSQPYSSYVKHFNKESIKASLQKVSIEYFYGGNQLGGTPDDESFYRDGKVDFELIRKSANYIKGLQIIKKLISLKNVVLMCSEEDPYTCHRNTLIARDLMMMGFEVQHIRSDGSIEMARLIPNGLEIQSDSDKLGKKDIH